MGVKTEHKQYALMKKTWQKCRDFMESETAVKYRNETYLPRLTDQSDEEYKSYKERTTVVMLAQKSNRAMCGMITRKDPFIGEAKGIQDLIEEVDSAGNSLVGYISSLLMAFFSTGRCATLVDVPYVSGPITVAQAETLGVRPRFIFYEELDIINWRVKRIKNVDVLTMVVLREQVEDQTTNDEFNTDVKYQYRVLDLVNDTTYRQRLFDDQEKQIGGDIIPKMGGRFLTYIPIVIHGGISVITPPLDQIVDLNLHHYQLSADEIHGLRGTALPTPYLFGEDPQGAAFPTHIGPTRMIGSDNENAKIGFLEFSGAGLGLVAAKLKRFEDLVAALSVQLITESVNQSATGASIDYASSTSTLAGMVTFLSAELTTALKYLAEWANRGNEKIEVILNKDFMPASMSPQMLQALLQAYQSQVISYETLYRNLAQGEITDPHKDFTEELSDIESNLPPGLNRPPANNTDNTDNSGDDQ